MTFKSSKLLQKLKKAQMHPDGSVMIDFEAMNVGTIRITGEPYRDIDLRKFKTSIYSTLDHLVKMGYIDYNRYTGEAFVTHAGWYAHLMTVKAALQFTVKDIIIPIGVAIATSVLMGLL